MTSSRRPWNSRHDLRRHFRKHGHKFQFATEAQYEASAQETIQLGAPFRFVQKGTPRIGYYHRPTNRLTIVDQGDIFIVTHFPPKRGEQYCRDLPGSTYR